MISRNARDPDDVFARLLDNGFAELLESVSSSALQRSSLRWRELWLDAWAKNVPTPSLPGDALASPSGRRPQTCSRRAAELVPLTNVITPSADTRNLRR